MYFKLPRGQRFGLILPGMPVTGVISFSYLEYFYYILAEARRMREGTAKTKEDGGVGGLPGRCSRYNESHYDKRMHRLDITR